MTEIVRPRFARTKARAACTIEPLKRDLLAQKVRYICSPKHKRGQFENEAGEIELGKLEPTASICPAEFNRGGKRLLKWLKDSLRDGLTGAPVNEDGYPQYVWHRNGKTWFEAKYSRNGCYHGYPVYDLSTLPDAYTNV